MMRTHYHNIKSKVREKAKSVGRSSDDITLIPISKNQSLKSIQALYQEGERNFGESRVQEGIEKIPHFPRDCHWHFIGPLQSNKVKKAILFFSLIHSVDSLELAKKISEISQQLSLTPSILLQVNITNERTKQGLSPKEWEKALFSLQALPNIKIEGLMTIAPYTEDERTIRTCFKELYLLREKWRQEMKAPELFSHLSMGMSHDYLIAIEEGATLLRIGSAIFC